MIAKNFGLFGIGLGLFLIGSLAMAKGGSSFDSQRLFQAQAKIVADPQEGLFSKIAMIRQAKFTIDIATYIFSADHSGSMVIRELAKAVSRGIAVRMLVDSSGSISADRNVLAYLKAIKPGINPLTGKTGSVEVKMFHSLQMLLAGASEKLVKYYHSVLLNFVGVNEAKTSAKELYQQLKALNRRSHDKILLVDAESTFDVVAELGGRNIADHYYGIPKVSAETYNDMEIIIRNDSRFVGPLVNTLGIELQTHFLNIYMDPRNEVVQPLKSQQKIQEITLQLVSQSSVVGFDPVLLNKFKNIFSKDYINTGFSSGQSSVVSEQGNIDRELIDIGKQTALNAGKSAGTYSIIESFRSIVQKAKKSIVIVSPYIFLAPDEIKRLQDWLDQDPSRTLRIVSNGLTTTDNDLAQSMVDTMVAPAFMANPLWPNKNKQVRFYGFGKLDDVSLGGDQFYGKLHAKYAIADNEWALVTTSNGDPRSRYLNSEVGFLSRDTQIAINLLKCFSKLVDQSTLWGSTEWEQVRQHPNNRIKRLRQKAANLVSKDFLFMI